ncbi:IclR family transcriptional regulator [Nocardioides sp.]|uniref:IclR family transcriptional regulator n=1 Tax=Nocardioides sp. TaxID=35761 RepID=UPI0039E59428
MASTEASPGEKKPPSYQIEALARGLQVLALFSERRPALRLTEIAAETGMLMPRVYRIAMTLTAEGYLEQLPNGHYRPGVKVLALGFAALKSLELPEIARPAIERLAEETSETANLGVLSGDQLVYLVRIRNRDLATSSTQVGSLLPAVYTSGGKVLLAYLEESDLRSRITSRSFDSGIGPRPRGDLERLLPELREIRRRGYALQNEEIVSGIRSVAAPVHGESGQVVAAVNVPVDAREWSAELLGEKLRPRVVEAAAEISALLGHRGGTSPNGIS